MRTNQPTQSDSAVSECAMRVYTAMVMPSIAADDPHRPPPPISLPFSRTPKPRTSWHVTFSFHAQVEPGVLEAFVSALGDELARLPAQQVSVKGSGAFYDTGTSLARYLWMRPTVLGATDQPFIEASAACSRAANASGMTADQYGFTPHLTIAELRNPQNAEAWLAATSEYEGLAWHWTALDVIEVRRGESGASSHIKLASVPLGAT